MERIRGVFGEALARRPEQRAAFLTKACGEDAALRAEVESLLACDQEASPDFMQPPEPPAGMKPARDAGGLDPLIGKTIGRYHVKGVIASGGMGTVYLAEQEQPRRDVALKVMRAGIASRSALRRFEYESQILARLRHPNIAQVYEAGAHPHEQSPDREQSRNREQSRDRDQSRDREGAVARSNDRLGDEPARAVPYFAMEYIPGARTITEYATEHKLNTRERLALFLQVCDGVHHGHQKGVIHRDLKPGNILVTYDQSPAHEQSPDREGGVGALERGPLADARGSDLALQAYVKVIDFGVARSTDSDMAVTTLRTDVRQLIGTLQYMSPEQCEADADELDTRSDVYALGVVLYELLWGQPPYDVSGTTIAGAARMICDAPPTPPSTITGRGTGGCGTGVPPVKRDVEMIVLKALKKNREERYQSAAELAADVRRYLRGEPTEARPPTAWTRALRWVSRHPVAATTVACVSVALGLVVTTYVSVWYLNIRPYEVELLEGGHEARLVAFNGTPLKTWTAESPGAITFAALIDRPAELGGGRLALLCFNRMCSEPFRGSLCAFDAEGDLEKPIWKKRIEPDDILPDLVAKRRSVVEEYNVQHCRIVDVFPESPGEEIVLSYARGGHSQRVLRIYDLSSDLLYQVWHDGEMGSCYWMSDVRLLVFAGDNHEPYWDAGELLGDGEKVCDRVVFALQPVPGYINDTHFLNDADRLSLVPTDDPGNPVWYLRLDPEDAVNITERITLHPPDPPNDPGRCVTCVVFVGDQPQPTVWWAINEHGEEVQGTRDWGDNYKSNRLQFPEGDDRRLPDPEQFKLRPMPPIESTPTETPKHQHAER